MQGRVERIEQNTQRAHWLLAQLSGSLRRRVEAALDQQRYVAVELHRGEMQRESEDGALERSDSGEYIFTVHLGPRPARPGWRVVTIDQQRMQWVLDQIRDDQERVLAELKRRGTLTANLGAV